MNKDTKDKDTKYYMWVVSQHGPNRETLYNEIGHPSTYTWILWWQRKKEEAFKNIFSHTFNDTVQQLININLTNNYVPI